MITFQEALDFVERNSKDLLLCSESIPVSRSLGRILAEEQFSRLDLPPFDKSAMDGYAILTDDIHEQYQVIETIAAGKTGLEKLKPKTAVKVMTGAPVPEGAGRVIMQEYTQQNGNFIKISKHNGSINICRRAEDMRVGDPVLPAGAFLGPLEAANLVACGITQVMVWKRPKVAVLSTGDEIVESMDQVVPGKIMNSNGPMLAMLSKLHGFEPVVEKTIRDDQQKTIQEIRDALDLADIVLLSGGVSEGEFDFVLKSFSQAGLKIHFSRIAVKPGKPTVFASTKSKLAFGLPGNPVSSFLMFHLFVLTAVAQATSTPSIRREFTMRLSCDVRRKKTERLEFKPCNIKGDGTVQPLEYHGSAHLFALMRADGFFMIPKGIAEMKAGDQVMFMPLPRVNP